MRLYHWLVILYTLVCAAALAAVPLSAAGVIAPDPLSAIPAMLLGFPWSYVLTGFGGSQSAGLNLILVALGMAINAGLIWLIGRRLMRS